MTPATNPQGSQKNDPLSTYLAEHPLDDILQGNANTSDKSASSRSNSDGVTQGPCARCSTHENTIATLEKQVKTAAELGQALLVRYEDYVASAEETKKALLSQLSSMEQSLKSATSETATVKSNNSQLVKQLSNVSESLFVSEAKVEQLTRTLQDQHSQLAKINNHAARTTGLESQISILESTRDNLQQELQMAIKERKLAESRWRKTERLLEKLTFQYECLEQSIGNDDSKSETATELPDDQETPIQGFIKSILNENSNLESTALDLRQQLAALKDEIKDLRSQPTMNKSDTQPSPKEIHHHHHFHVLPPNFQSNNQNLPDTRQRQLKFTYNATDSIPTPPGSAEKGLGEGSQHTSSHPHFTKHRRTYSSPDTREDDSDTCTGDETTSDYLYEGYPTFASDKNTVRKFISHETGLRGLAKSEVSMVDPVLYSHYPGSPNVLLEEDEDISVVYSPMPKLHRTTSHDSIFSALDVSMQTPGSPLLSPTVPGMHPDYLNLPEINGSHRPFFYSGSSAGSKSEVANISAEITFTAPQQANRIGSKMLLSAAVANNARRRTSLASFRSTVTEPSARSVSTGSSTSLAPHNGKWSNLFSKLRGGNNATPAPATIQEQQSPPTLKPQTTLCTSSPHSAVSTPVVPIAVFPSPLSSTYSSSSQYMQSLSSSQGQSDVARPLRTSASTSFRSAVDSFFTPVDSTKSTENSELFDERAIVEALNEAI